MGKLNTDYGQPYREWKKQHTPSPIFTPTVKLGKLNTDYGQPFGEWKKLEKALQTKKLPTVVDIRFLN